MRHLKKKIKLHKKTDQRRAMVKILANNLITYESIKTTPARAKAAQIYVEKLITKAKKQDLTALRNLLSMLPKKSANKLYYDIAKQYQDRQGGYTRIIKLSERRLKDASQMVILQLVK